VANSLQPRHSFHNSVDPDIFWLLCISCNWRQSYSSWNKTYLYQQQSYKCKQLHRNFGHDCCTAPRPWYFSHSGKIIILSASYDESRYERVASQELAQTGHSTSNWCESDSLGKTEAIETNGRENRMLKTPYFDNSPSVYNSILL
jgi:hypothetical protein